MKLRLNPFWSVLLGYSRRPFASCNRLQTPRHPTACTWMLIPRATSTTGFSLLIFTMLATKYVRSLLSRLGSLPYKQQTGHSAQMRSAENDPLFRPHSVSPQPTFCFHKGWTLRKIPELICPTVPASRHFAWRVAGQRRRQLYESRV